MNQVGVPIGSYLYQALEQVRVRTEYPEMRCLSTGVPSLDDHIGTVIGGGRLIVFAAPTGTGKTGTAAALAAAFGAQTDVLLWTMEDDPDDVATRILAAGAGEHLTELRSGYATGTIPDTLEDAARNLSRLRVTVEADLANAVTIARRVASWTRGRDSADSLPGVVIIDQLSHIIQDCSEEDKHLLTRNGYAVPPRPSAQETAHYGWIVDTLKRVAKVNNVLVVLMHQTNNIRDDDGKPTMESIRSSQRIGHSSDATLILWCPDRLKNPDHELCKSEPKWVPNEMRRTWILGPKVRQAERFELEVRWDPGRNLLADKGTWDRVMTFPDKPSDRAIEGFAKYSALRERLESRRRELYKAADQHQLEQ